MDYERIMAGYPQQKCALRSGVVSYREAGSGEPLVLLHGISSGAASWVSQLEGLESEAWVVAWDAPGYGASTALESDLPKASDYADVLAEFVDELGLETFVLAGHSLGAMMAAAFASRYPSRVSKLVLLSPARGYAEANREEREGRYRRRMDMLEKLGPKGLAHTRSTALLSSSAATDMVNWVAWNMERLDPEGYRQAARMLARDDITYYASGYEGPVVVRSGQADAITPVGKCQSIAQAFGASYESFSGLGHACYLEGPKQVNNLFRHVVLTTGHRGGDDKR